MARYISPVRDDFMTAKLSMAASIALLTLQLQLCADDFKEMEWEGIEFMVYAAAPEKVELHWLDEETGKPIRKFSRVQEIVKGKGRRTVLLMNGGLFEQGGIPCGLHIQEGKKLRPLNLADGEGNFYMKPNGVFLVTKDGKAMILESGEYARSKISPDIALQSGPMLLRGGMINSKFAKVSANRMRSA